MQCYKGNVKFVFKSVKNSHSSYSMVPVLEPILLQDFVCELISLMKSLFGARDTNFSTKTWYLIIYLKCFSSSNIRNFES